MLYLDACIIIYWVELAQPYYDTFIKQLKKLDAKYSSAEIAVSRLSYLECCVNPLKHKKSELLQLYHDFFANSALTIIEIDAKVIELATQIRANYGLKTPDAIQAASAMTLENCIFISNDKCFKKIDDLSILLI